MPKTNKSRRKTQRKRNMGVIRKEYKTITLRVTSRDEEDLRSRMRRSEQSNLTSYEKSMGDLLDIFPECNVCHQQGDDFETREYGLYCPPEPTFNSVGVIPRPEFHWNIITGFAHQACAERTMKNYKEAHERYKKYLEEYEKGCQDQYDNKGQFEIKCSEWMCKAVCLVPRGVGKWVCDRHFEDYQRQPLPMLSPVSEYASQEYAPQSPQFNL